MASSENEFDTPGLGALTSLLQGHGKTGWGNNPALQTQRSNLLICTDP